jgi:hypothetical protein
VEIGAFVQSNSQDSTPRKFTLWRVISALLLFGAGAFLIGLGITRCLPVRFFCSRVSGWR